MNLPKLALKLIIALFLAKFIADSILHGKFLILIALCAGFVFFFLLPRKTKFYLFTLTAFYPFMFKGKVGPLPNPEWIWMIAPLMFFGQGIELLLERKPLFSRKANLFFLAVGIFTLWTAVNYIMNPVLGQELTGASRAEAGGIRSYFIIVIGITVFFYSYWFFKYKQIDVNKWLKFLLAASLILGFLRLVTYFTNNYIPFLGGTFQYATISKARIDSAFRIPGLSEVATLGIVIIISLLHRKKWNANYLFLFLSFIVLLVLSGGRSAFFGTLLAMLVYTISVNRKYFLPVMICSFILAGTYVLFDMSLDESKFGRIAQVSEDAIEKEEARLETFKIAFSIFQENPIFGKGIGYQEDTTVRSDSLEDQWKSEHITKQLSAGGHGAYMSMLMLFGIGGVFFIVVMVFGSGYYAFKIIRNSATYQEDVKLTFFIFLYVIILSVEFIPGGNGYSNMRLWFIAGMLAGIMSKERTGIEFK